MQYTLREYVANLDHDTCIQIAKDYQQFEADGYIGDCNLRHHAGIIKYDVLRVPETLLTLCMDRLVFEVYRRFTYESQTIG